MHVIHPHTRISELIKANQQSIAAIASLAKPLEKLKNPLLRKVLAARVTISEAAKMGGCGLTDFKRVLEPLGFSLQLEADQQPDTVSKSKNHLHNEGGSLPATSGQTDTAPDWLDRKRSVQMDVRQATEDGNDPLKDINTRYKQLAIGQTLCIINSFIPAPLIHLLEKRGAQTFVEQVADQEYHTYFLKGSNRPENEPQTQISTLSLADFEDLLQRYAEQDIVRLDVRALPMPQPMERILETLPELHNEKVLYVRHRRVPLHLLEEMENYDFVVKLCGVSEGDVRLLIHRGETS